MPGLDRTGPTGMGPMTGGDRGWCSPFGRSFARGELRPWFGWGRGMGMATKLSEIKPDMIYLSSCLANATPGCPYAEPEDLAKILENKTGVKVVLGTHDYR